MPILFKRESNTLDTRSQRLASVIEAAALADYTICYLPRDWPLDRKLKDYLSAESSGQWALLSGVYDQSDYYQRLYQECQQMDIGLLNTPSQSAKAMLSSNYYPLLSELTARSWFVGSELELSAISEELAYPVFVKGDIKSKKELGAASCLIESADTLNAHYWKLQASGIAGDQTMVIRELLPLRSLPSSDLGGREYRVFLYRGQVIDFGFYWPGEDPFGSLRDSEREELLLLSVTASQRLDVPLLAVDCGQLKDHSWTIIEIGDPQYAELTQVSMIRYWHRLRHLKDGRDLRAR